MKLDKVDMDITLPPLFNAAVAASGFTIEQIKSKSRHEPLLFVRYMLSAILYENYHWSTTKIGRALNRDHASVLTGIKKYHEIIDDNSYGYQVEHVIHENFHGLIAIPDREQRIRIYLNRIRTQISDLPQDKQDAIGIMLNHISLELKKDRPQNRVKLNRVGIAK